MADTYAVLNISDEMTEAGTWVLNACYDDPDLPQDALVAAIFMAMMTKYDPEVVFSAGDGREFKFRTIPRSI